MTFQLDSSGLSNFGANWGTMGANSNLLPQLDDYSSPSLGGATNVAPKMQGGNTWGGMLGMQNADGTTTQGWGGMALGAAQSIGNIFMGMKQYGMAKDQLAQSKKQFDLNFGAQKKTTNAALEDRQAARVASNPGAYQSVGEYMKKNGV